MSEATYAADSLGASGVRHTVARERGAESGRGLVAELASVKVAQPEVEIRIGSLTWYALEIDGAPWFATIDIRDWPGCTATVVETFDEVRATSSEHAL